MEDTTTTTKNATKNIVNTSEINKGVDNMVKKAETLKLEELNLSNRTRSYIERSGMTIDDLVLTGRKAAIVCTTRFEPPIKKPKWKQELVAALYEAGFIRDDINLITCRIWELYSAVLADGNFPGFIRYYSFTNQDYERLTPVSDKDLRKMEEVLSSLSPMEKTVIELRFGLRSIKQYELEEIGKEFMITPERTRQHEARALRKLRQPSRLCKLPALFGFRLYPNNNHPFLE